MIKPAQADFIQASREAKHHGRRAVWNGKENQHDKADGPETHRTAIFCGGGPAPRAYPDPVRRPRALPGEAYTQAELDSIVGKRIAKAMKGMPSEAELSDYRSWKESQQTERERWDALTRERDESRAALSEAWTKVEQYEREKFLLSKGVPADDVDYYAFKIGKLVTDATYFEKAAIQFLQDNPPAGTVRVDLTAPLGGGAPAPTENETMNRLIREARK
mgnify:CR=1 FL=1